MAFEIKDTTYSCSHKILMHKLRMIKLPRIIIKSINKKSKGIFTVDGSKLKPISYDKQ
jgi:hypothetical protein